MDVALVSCRNLPEPDVDEELLNVALAGAGIDAAVQAWDDPAVDWSAARMTVLRSCWNYPLQARAFTAWAEAVAAVSELWNPLPVVRWNLHKSYLLELERNDVPVTPTELVPTGSDRRLESILAERGWEVAVVKPAVSGGSYKTMRADADTLEAGERHLRELATERDVLVQRYLSSVERHGERALVWIDGELTHAVRKSPRFSGEDESVSERAVEISPAEAALAVRALATVEGPLLYARVDAAPGPDGEPVVMELELLEPSLFFCQSPAALERFVAGIARRLDRSTSRA
jgi:hypothetical protein